MTAPNLLKDPVFKVAVPDDTACHAAQADPRLHAEQRPLELRRLLAGRPLVLIGMMGAGKSSVGRKLAQRIGIPFFDADGEIERAAGLTIPEIFARHGEAYFRAGERRVIARLLRQGECVLATGGGAFMDAETRERIAATGVSLWLDAEFDVLMRRVRKRSNRPLLQTPDPEAALRALIEQRYPTYALADATLKSRDVSHDEMVDAALDALLAYGHAAE